MGATALKCALLCMSREAPLRILTGLSNRYSPAGIDKTPNFDASIARWILAESEVSPELKAEGKQGYSTAEVRSKTRIRYGYFELKFKAMNALVCNAFWLNDPLDSDKKYKAGDKIEEIDIFEIFGKDTNPKQAVAGRYFMTTHVADTPYVESKVWIGRKVSCENPVIPVKFAEGYNVAGILWTPENLVWTLNGKFLREMKN